jgi:hypothetical protein
MTKDDKAADARWFAAVEEVGEVGHWLDETGRAYAFDVLLAGLSNGGHALLSQWKPQ